jgi:hypothetical protein
MLGKPEYGLGRCSDWFGAYPARRRSTLRAGPSPKAPQSRGRSAVGPITESAAFSIIW